MPIRKAQAVWEGGLKDGKGVMGFGTFKGPYTAGSRFEEAAGTNPEELIAAAHAGCFSMALAAELAGKGFKPGKIETEARVRIEKKGDGFAIATSQLSTRAQVPGIENEEFQRIASGAKTNCPVSKALAGVQIGLEAVLVK